MEINKMNHTSFENKSQMKKFEDSRDSAKMAIKLFIGLSIASAFASIRFLIFWIEEEKLSYSTPINYENGISFAVFTLLAIYFFIEAKENYGKIKSYKLLITSLLNSLKYEIIMPNGEILYYDSVDENTIKGAHNILDAYGALLQDTTIQPNISMKYKESLLPFPKNKITKASEILLSNSSEEYIKSLKTTLIFLDDYIPDNEFEERYLDDIKKECDGLSKKG